MIQIVNQSKLFIIREDQPVATLQGNSPKTQKIIIIILFSVIKSARQ